MKTEDGGIDDLLPSLPPPPPPPSPQAGAKAVLYTNDAAESAQTQNGPGQALPKRTVCDHCRRRRIRCDGQLPCQPCVNASLACKRDHVPLKRGPKRGRGRVINELRERYSIEQNASAAMTNQNTNTANNINSNNKHSRESSSDLVNGIDMSVPSTPAPPSDISWQNVSSDPRHAVEPRGAFSSEHYRPTTRSYMYLMPRCVNLYYEHIYPIMPLPYMPAVRNMVNRSPAGLAELTFSDRNFLYALCALTCFHMSGQNITADAPHPSWECAGRFFLDECISARQSYDFFNDASLNAVISSFWLSTSFFEINQSRKSWVYLREALTLAQEIALHDDASYAGLDAAEKLCRQRTFWQLFVTERSFAILRSKPITLKKTPSLPTTRHPYEAPEIHSGFRQLISSYTPLDESFVNAWNEGSDPRVTAATYLTLQAILAVRPPFLAKAKSEIVTVTHGLSTASHTPEDRSPTGHEAPPPSPSSPAEFSAGLNAALRTSGVAGGDDAEIKQENEPETTDIQKADLLITQQWLRLIVWQSSFRQQLLSWTAPDESMRFAFPLTIAARTAAVIQSLPPQAIEVHGMGIFEKIFEIGTWSMNVLQACDMASASGNNVAGGGAAMGMDFAGASDMGVLGVGRMSFSVDPLEFFVRTLSASPNSRTQYAERLLMFANERTGGGMRMALSPSLSSPSSPELLPAAPAHWSHDEITAAAGTATTAAAATTTEAAGPPTSLPTVTDATGRGNVGTVLGEVGDDFHIIPSMNHNHHFASTTVPNGQAVPFAFDASALDSAAFEVGPVAYDGNSLDGVVYDGTVSPTGVSVGGGSYGSIHGGSIHEGISRNHSYGSFTEELQAGTDYSVFLPSGAQSPIENNGFAGFDLSQTNLAS
ncbi:hypothetical protein HMPREF1624_05772 [Sporothrix schenckii ATCC 58251]|uniref:Zn(2)-C6 fungal-type domain-containing protein n=1 Tax=Sporothrix schenckii (strain ATCC 58251 / de Perez 2211183) TaxID=1391915 RepID=U7PRN5_SPOS1|nr:hypothetical protein HMPREF1624_05772 [Sporothrix schenckii ATCC 58251]